MTLLTLNLWGTNPPFRTRLARLDRFLGEHEIDVVALQEVTVDGGAPQSDRVARDAGYGWAHFAEAFRWGDLVEGVAVLTRCPSVALPTLALWAGPSRRALQQVRVDLGGGRSLLVGNTHLAHRRTAGDLRVWQARRVLASLERRAEGAPVVLLGDLNDVPDSETLRVLRSSPALPLRDCWSDHRPADPGHTYARTNPWAVFRTSTDRRIDYALASPTLTVESAEVVLADLPASDHYGLLTTLSLH